MSRDRKFYLKVIRTQRGLIAVLQRELCEAKQMQQPVWQNQEPESRSADRQKRPLIFRSEMDYISRCILDYPNIETGGQLFGYWTSDGFPVVMYAIGPGPRANHQSTFFNQDVNYLLEVGNALRNRYGLQHIGEWHSHHRLGLARPSGHDANTMVSTIREKNLGRFLLCIGNCDERGSSLNPFMCDTAGCYPSSWNIIESDSPVRNIADSGLSPILIHPRMETATYSDPALSVKHPSANPHYASSYWLNDKTNGIVLKRIQEYVRSRNYPCCETAVKLDESGLVHIVTSNTATNGVNVSEDILFPIGFPEAAPQCILKIGSEKETKSGRWKYKGDIFASFMKYYKDIND